MKKVNLGLFFLGEDEADNLLETEQTGEKDGTAVDGKSDGEANHPVDIQLFDKEGDEHDAGHEKEDMEPIATSYLNLDNTFGKEILQESRNGLHAEAGAGRAYRLETRYDDEIQQDIDDYARGGHEVELLETAIGGEQRAEDVSR